uniref:ATP synthase subunit a n=1 Tax=Laelaps nuttalli TaxID=2902835 RepID=A0AAU6QDN7_9ACAR
MMLNLFSVFDPTTSVKFSMNWLSMMLFMLYIFPKYWIQNSRISWMFNYIMTSLMKEFKSNFLKSNFKTFFFFMGLFWLVFFNNFLGLFPYIFTATSHLSVTLSLSLSFWLVFMLYGWLNKMNMMFSHLVPLGSPIYLASFMVLIETVSNLIRPITLSVRLAANMIAGHLLLTLLSNLSEMMFLIYPLTYIVILALMSLEMAVSIIQSYVFVTLMSLYFNEI